YDKAIAQLKLTADFEFNKQQYNQRRIDIPATLAKIKESIAGLATVAQPEAAPEITLAQSEQALTAANAILEEAKKNVATWENEPKRRAERRTKIPEETNAAKQNLEQVKSKLAVPDAEGQKTELTQANRTLLLTQQRTLESQIAANTEELLFYDAAGDLLSARRDLAARQLSAAEKVVEFWQQKVNALRQKEAEAAKKEAIRAKEETKYDDPAIQDIAKKNADLAGIQAELVSKNQALTQYSKIIDVNLAGIKSSFNEIRTKVETAGKVTDTMGMVLLRQRDKLPNISQNLRKMRGRPTEISLTQFHEMDCDKQWSELIDLTDEMKVIDSRIDPNKSLAEREAIQKQAAGYYEIQHNLLRAIADLYGDYSAKLANLDAKEREYVNTVREYAAFIDENILWVKSSLPLRLSDLRESAYALGWLLSVDNWRQVATILWADYKSNVSVYLASLLIVVSLIVLHPKAHKAIEALSDKVRHVKLDSFLHTFKVLAFTVFLAGTWPVVLFLLWWRLRAAMADNDFSQAIAAGLLSLVPVVFSLSFLRHFAMPHGLAHDHLRMRQDPMSFLRRLFGWYLILIIPITLIVQFMQVQQKDEQWYNSAGRLFFIMNLILLALLQLLLLRPTGPLIGPYLKQRQGGWLERLRYIWYPLSFILPVIFAILAGMGYFYAARHLFEKFVITIVLILLMILVRALFVRWLMVAQRRLALLERQKREAAGQETQEQQEPASSIESQQEKIKDDETTIFQISRQTRRLIDALTLLVPLGGIWYVWNDILPALGALAKIELWRMGAENIVTLGSLATALVVVVLTVIITRNVPGLLEIIVLRRLPLDRGVRFAIITLFRYTLAVVGTVLAFSEIGIGWSKVQWLIAAMTVGLGFGLQEIFANFVSGLIILFEQPIRVDDVVTIGDVTGKVSKIRIRATTIRRWDQRELLVPNKEFITGRLINWTLSDNVLRREFVVGIAYGSDIAKAEQILYDVAKANPLVLTDPAPVVIFKNFGNSSLEFELRVYISGIDNYVPVWHDINCAIDTEFRKGGIEIAFPQQDLHIRSIDTSIPINTNKPEH
ncbi:MAG: mechanosensitive ion channel, partial [Sedimentisphaerales bacterium]|nr:mechanosensitive ion channel [Sedimentisphaerales bacterium]